MREHVKSVIGVIVEPGVKPAQSYGDAAEQIAERMRGMPKAIRDGDRMVPVSYDVQIVQLVSDEEHAANDAVAYWAARARNDRDRRAVQARNACLARYTHAQQSDDGIGVAFMTRGERELASMEWSRQLALRVQASERRDAERERNRVVIDHGWDD